MTYDYDIVLLCENINTTMKNKKLLNSNKEANIEINVKKIKYCLYLVY
jgi:hypothetical protein